MAKYVASIAQEGKAGIVMEGTWQIVRIWTAAQGEDAIKDLNTHQRIAYSRETSRPKTQALNQSIKTRILLRAAMLSVCA